METVRCARAECRIDFPVHRYRVVQLEQKRAADKSAKLYCSTDCKALDQVDIMPSGELESDRLAVLSDAVEEAGCDDPAILEHLRSPGPHFRGCHVLDLLLGNK